MYKFKKCVRAKRSVSTFSQQLEALLGLRALTTLKIWPKNAANNAAKVT